jgi:shikimate dehydrogenase
MTTPYAEVIGDPIAHSKSPIIHKHWLKLAGIDADYRATHVKPDELAAYVAARRTDPDWRGTNVTIPHKQAVIPFLNRLDPAAEKIGAVNAIRPEQGDLVGYNTDFGGFLEPLRPALARQHLFRMARIFGAGGAARAIALALWSEGFTIVIAARNPDQARALRASFNPDDSLIAPLSHFAEPTDFAWDDRSGIYDLVVNTTSLGMKGNPPLEVDFSHVPPGATVYDIVYAPLETPLLAEAKARGHRTIDGLAMLIGQAAEAFELFFGIPAPRQADGQLREKLTT